MTFKRNQLRDAINIALCVGAVSMLSMGTAFAQDAASATDVKAKNLDTITVTGSRVRRVETETASPVVVVTRKDIEKTGKLTIGEIINELPSISGSPTTAAINNGGGTGAATADVRGLGSQRTLVLIDGHRPGPTPVDLNSIPLDLVERIEVLTEGSSTVYGSDAIGGVINFIMRKNYNGAQYTASYGESGHHDSARKGQSFIFGQSGDKGNVVAGVEYNKFDAVPAASRPFAAHAYNLSYSSYYHIDPNGGFRQKGTSGAFGADGFLNPGGSSRNPNGRISLSPALKAHYGCGSVAHDPTKTGTALSDFVCFGTNGTGPYDYQPQNLILTPQERTNAFAMATYNLTDNISAYLDFYHQKQTSHSVIAPLPFDTNNDGVVISKDNLYNPFGEDFGVADPANNVYQFRTRFNSIGERIANNSTTNDTVFAGLKGNFGQTWSWDAGFDYNHLFFITNPTGYPNYSKLKQALGPSMLIGGTPTCVAVAGNAATAITGCTPLNIFNLNDPSSIAILQSVAGNPTNTSSFIERTVEFNASGDLFDLPAGAVKLAVGADSRREYQNNRVDSIAVTNGAGGTCDVAQEVCSTPLVGAFSVKEAYAELFVPILKDVPGAYRLNLDLGTRYSKYNIFAGNDSSKLAIEWRPIKDLLVRASAADIFRAPTAADLFAGSAGGAPPFGGDPCVGLSAAGVAAHPNACGPYPGPPGIPSTTVSGQTTGVTEGSVLAGFKLSPEKGRSYDFGLVYDPEYVPGLSTSVDFYRITLNNLISAISPDTVIADCFNSETSPFCSLIHRGPSGGITFFTLPSVNLGSLVTDGFDASARYKLPVFAWGQFTVSTDLTHINKYDVNVDPANSTLEIQHNAGHLFNTANFAKWRGNLALDWSKGNWNAGYRLHWVGKAQFGDLDPGQNTSVDACNFQTNPFGICPGPVVEKIPNYFESFVTLGYNFGQIGTMDARVDVGVDNVFDKQPPFIWSNAETNGNTDVTTYDTIGRLFWARFTAKF